MKPCKSRATQIILSLLSTFFKNRFFLSVLPTIVVTINPFQLVEEKAQCKITVQARSHLRVFSVWKHEGRRGFSQECIRPGCVFFRCITRFFLVCLHVDNRQSTSVRNVNADKNRHFADWFTTEHECLSTHAKEKTLLDSFRILWKRADCESQTRQF